MCQVTMLLLLIVPQATSAAAEPEVNRLVRQLGSDSYREREAASRALRALGEKALASLRTAADSPDAEIRRRVSGLLKPLEAKVRRREIEAIKASRLTPKEKGWKLKAFIHQGMRVIDVERILGRTPLCSGGGVGGVFFSHNRYPEFGLRIDFTNLPPDERLLVERVVLEVIERKVEVKERPAAATSASPSHQ